MPRNLASGRAYRGINPLLLHSLGYESPWFVTYRQAKERGGHVRQGQRGAPVVFWKWHDLEDRDTGEPKRVPVLRYYTVFNVQQCEGVAAPAVSAPERAHSPIAQPSALWPTCPSRQPFTAAWLAPATARWRTSSACRGRKCSTAAQPTTPRCLMS
jgi:hypothetical protein